MVCRILANVRSPGQLGKTMLQEAKASDQPQGNERPTIDLQAMQEMR